MKNLSDINEALALLFKGSVTFGGLILFIYFADTHFYPSSLTAGDALLLLLTTLSFGTIFLIGLGYGAFSTLWIVALLLKIYRATRPSPLAAVPETLQGSPSTATETTAKWYEIFARPTHVLRLSKVIRSRIYYVCSVFVFSIVIIFFINSNQNYKSLIMSFCGGGILLIFGLAVEKEEAESPTALPQNYIKIPEEEKRAQKKKITLITLAVFITIFLIARPNFLAELSMKVISVRIDDTTLYLNKENAEKLKDISSAMGAPLCIEAGESGNVWLAYRVDVLWNSIGPTMDVRIGQHESPANPVDVPLDASGVYAIRSAQTKTSLHCP